MRLRYLTPLHWPLATGGDGSVEAVAIRGDHAAVVPGGLLGGQQPVQQQFGVLLYFVPIGRVAGYVDQLLWVRSRS